MVVLKAPQVAQQMEDLSAEAALKAAVDLRARLIVADLLEAEGLRKDFDHLVMVEI